MEQGDQVARWLRELQQEICTSLETLDGEQQFRSDPWTRQEGLRGQGDSRVLSDGAVFERLGVNLSIVAGDRLPPSASQQRPDLAGCGFRAMGLSLVAHPRNPYVPTAHMNLRYFETTGEEQLWWFGGGFDLTPYYGFVEDVRHWHYNALQACGSEKTYLRFKQACDDYFYLPHRQEARGIGGLFFDDWNENGFEASLELARRIGSHFLPGYMPIVERRRETAWGAREREFQLYRRGRYVEFNLVHDRGTLFGLQSGGRVESILMSMPPLAAWKYDWRPQPGTPEAALYTDFLPVRDWLTDSRR